MKKWMLGLSIGVFLLSVGFSEPTVTPSGTMEVIGSTRSKGQSSFISEFDLTLDINLSDYISGVVETQGVSSNKSSSMNVRQGFLLVGNLNGTNHTESARVASSMNEEYFKNPDLIDKAISKVNLFRLPEATSSLFTEKNSPKEVSLHSIIFADLQSKIMTTPQKQQPHSNESVRLAKSN